MSLKCPVCGSLLDRVHCRSTDRIIGLFVPVRRYRCHNITCKWEMRQISGSQKRTTSVKDTKFKLAVLMIILTTGLGISVAIQFLSSPPSQPASSASDFSADTTKILREASKKLR